MCTRAHGHFNVCLRVADVFLLDFWLHLAERKCNFRIRKVRKQRVPNYHYFLKYSFIKSVSLPGNWKVEPQVLGVCLSFSYLKVA